MTADNKTDYIRTNPPLSEIIIKQFLWPISESISFSRSSDVTNKHRIDVTNIWQACPATIILFLDDSCHMNIVYSLLEIYIFKKST